MQIRPAGRGDLDRLSHLRLEFLADVHGVPVSALTDELLEPTRTFTTSTFDAGQLHSWLAVDAGDGSDGDGELAGGVSVVLMPAPPRPGDVRAWEGYVINMYVRPPWRRRGLGRQLFDACLSGAPALGVRRFFLMATPDGRPLYEENGFATNDTWLELRLPSP